MNLLERLRKNRFAPAFPQDPPKTRGVSTWTGFRPLGEHFAGAGKSLPSPTRLRCRSPSDWVRGRVITREDRTQVVRVIEEFERKSRSPGRQGSLKSSGVEIARALFFGFLNMKTGQLNPSLDAIVKATGWSRNTVKAAIRRLRDAGFLSWIQRTIRGRQTSNAYTVGGKFWPETTIPSIFNMERTANDQRSSIVEAVKAVALSLNIDLLVLDRCGVGKT